MPRPKLYGAAKTRSIEIYLTDELVEKLREVAVRHALNPSAYLRSLVVTHLNKVKTAKES